MRSECGKGQVSGVRGGETRADHDRGGLCCVLLKHQRQVRDVAHDRTGNRGRLIPLSDLWHTDSEWFTILIMGRHVPAVYVLTRRTTNDYPWPQEGHDDNLNDTSVCQELLLEEPPTWASALVPQDEADLGRAPARCNDASQVASGVMTPIFSRWNLDHLSWDYDCRRVPETGSSSLFSTGVNW